MSRSPSQLIQRVNAGLRMGQERLRQSEQIYMVLIAVAIGLLGGLSAVGFRLLIRYLNDVAWHQGQPTLEYLQSLPVWWKILAPAVGGVIVGLITHRFAREARGHGVPEVMEAVALHGGRIRPRVVVAKMFASAVCISSGGSVGREGPIVQIGSALGSTIGQWLRIDERRLRTLVGCGAAAGIAATFNAPVAGALFAVEIVLGDFGVAQFSPIVISSVAATVVSQHYLGDFPAFAVPAYSLVRGTELLAYAGLGLLAGIVALAFIRLLYGTEDLFDRIRLSPPIKAMIGGAIVGTIAIWLPHVYGVGYEAINEALNGNLAWSFMLLLVVAKLVAVSITIGSGGSGGIFAPSLFIGAMLGGSVGTVVHSLWPLSTGGPGAYALVGMGAVVAAGTHAPITAILIIFELTNDYKIMLPLMISCIIATLLATKMESTSIYTRKLLRRGVDLMKGRDVNVLRAVPVREQMRPPPFTVSPGKGIGELMSHFVDHAASTAFVVDEDDRLLGLVTADNIRPIIHEAGALDVLVIAADVMSEDDFPVMAPDDSLADAMKYLGIYRGEIPVLEDGRLVGVIIPATVIERYNTEIFKREMVESVMSAVSPAGERGTGVATQAVPTLGDSAVAEIPVPASFVGKSIRDLHIRQIFGVSILMIRQPAAGGGRIDASPEADYVFREGDSMLVMGPNERLRQVRYGVAPRKAD